MLKKSIVCATMVGIVCFALASSGGGKKKSSSSSLGVIPISANGSLTLKSRPTYSGSHMLSISGSRTSPVYRSVITYQMGNTTYLVPSQYRMNKVSDPKISFKSPTLSFRSNLNIVDLKIRLCK